MCGGKLFGGRGGGGGGASVYVCACVYFVSEYFCSCHHSLC